jgi:Putative prokaryotic signal transducing protein
MAWKSGQGDQPVAMPPTGKRRGRFVQAVLKTNNPVLLDFARALLVDAGISAEIFDSHMSVMDGSLGILPRRLMVADDDFARAERVLKDAMPEQSPPKP